MNEIEKAAENYILYKTGTIPKIAKKAFIAGSNWQKERSYSEEDIRNAYIQGVRESILSACNSKYCLIYKT